MTAKIYIHPTACDTECLKQLQKTTGRIVVYRGKKAEVTKHTGFQSRAHTHNNNGGDAA